MVHYPEWEILDTSEYFWIYSLPQGGKEKQDRICKCLLFPLPARGHFCSVSLPADQLLDLVHLNLTADQ